MIHTHQELKPSQYEAYSTWEASISLSEVNILYLADPHYVMEFMNIDILSTKHLR